MKSISTHANRPIQQYGAQLGQGQIIEGQWCEVPVQLRKRAVIPMQAWLVVASVGVFMGVIASVVTEPIATENAIWFMGGMIIGGMLSACAVGVFSYLVYDASRQS